MDNKMIAFVLLAGLFGGSSTVTAYGGD